MTTLKFKEFIQNFRTFVFIGNGGTGKTTVSASWAIELAKQGERVGLLTIDPSKRIGDAFGMNVETDHFKTVTIESGSIDVYLIDARRIIQEFVVEHFGQEQYIKLQKNRIFSQITSVLSENQSISTIYKLHHMMNSKKYDRIVVDTPPSNNSMDFFTSPDFVIRLFKENIVAKAAIEAKGFSFLSGQKLFRRVYNFLVGEEFVKDIESFFQILFSFQEYIVKSSEELTTFLKNQETHFLAVTLPDVAKVEEVLSVTTHLEQQGINVGTLMVNRSYPTWLVRESRVDFLDQDHEIKKYYHSAHTYYESRLQQVQQLVKSKDHDIQIYFLPENTQELESKGVSGISENLIRAFEEAQ